MSNGGLTTKGENCLVEGRIALRKGELSEAVRFFDDLQVSDPGSWQAMFYFAYSSAYELVARIQRCNVFQIAMVMGEVKSHIEGLSRRIGPVVDLILNGRMSTAAEPLAEIIDAICELQACSCRTLMKVKRSFFWNDLAGREFVRKLNDQIAGVGYGLGDVLGARDAQKYKDLIIRTWKSSCEYNSRMCYDEETFKKYAAALKELDPSIDIKLKSVRPIIIAAIVVFCLIGIVYLFSNLPSGQNREVLEVQVVEIEDNEDTLEEEQPEEPPDDKVEDDEEKLEELSDDIKPTPME